MFAFSQPVRVLGPKEDENRQAINTTRSPDRRRFPEKGNIFRESHYRKLCGPRKRYGMGDFTVADSAFEPRWYKLPARLF